jgi:hypothetical protein
MKKLIIGLAGAAALLWAMPASAEDFGIRLGDVGVHIGRDHDGDHHWRRDRGPRVGVYSEPGCRDVTVRKRMPDGSVVIKKSTRC